MGTYAYACEEDACYGVLMVMVWLVSEQDFQGEAVVHLVADYGEEFSVFVCGRWERHVLL